MAGINGAHLRAPDASHPSMSNPHLACHCSCLPTGETGKGHPGQIQECSWVLQYHAGLESEQMWHNCTPSLNQSCVIQLEDGDHACADNGLQAYVLMGWRIGYLTLLRRAAGSES